MRLPNFIGGSCPAQSPTAALERTINLYPEPSETPGEKGRGKLYPTPGMTTFATASVDTPVRGMFYTHDERLFAVIGATLYDCDSEGESRRGRHFSGPIAGRRRRGAAGDPGTASPAAWRRWRRGLRATQCVATAAAKIACVLNPAFRLAR